MKKDKIEKWQTNNKTRVFFLRRTEIPMVEINVTFDAGSCRDNNNHGISQCTNAMLNQGTENFSAKQIAETLESVGAKFYSTADREMAVISILSLTSSRYLNTALQVFTEIIGAPTFPNKHFIRIQKLILSALLHQHQMPDTIARNAFYKTIYAHHPYGHSVLGSHESILSLKMESVRDFYTKFYTVSNAIITIVGNLTNLQAERTTNQITQNLPVGNIPGKLPLASSVQLPSTHHISFPSEQTHIMLGQVGINYKDNNYFPAILANYILGGSPLTSRLVKNVRRDRGLVYQIASSVNPMKANGPFAITLQSHKSKALDALKITRNVIEDFMNNGPTSTELISAKKKIINSFHLSLATNNDIATSLRKIGFYDLSLQYLNDYCSKTEAVTLKEINDYFCKNYLLERLATVILEQEAIKNSYD